VAFMSVYGYGKRKGGRKEKRKRKKKYKLILYGK